MGEPLRVWVDQHSCTGDGLCVQYAPEVFEVDIDGLADLRLDVLGSAGECPGERIHVEGAKPAE